MVLQADGKLIVSGQFFVGNGYNDPATLLRMNADGSSDPTYAPASDGAVYPIALQADGQLFAGGAGFTMIGGLSRANLARLNTAQPALQALTVNGTLVTWMRSGSAAEVSGAPELEFSVAGSLFVPLGQMQRIAGGWQYSGFSAPLGQTFFLRARAATPSGNANGSSGRIESTRWFAPVSDVIFADGFQ